MEKNETKIFNSDIVNLCDLDNYRFSIPTYQRPYVWGDEELKKLLDDFYKSFAVNHDSTYYISAVLTREEDNVAELIDGQQRFTTLWLISFVVSKIQPDSDLLRFLKNKENLRLGFEIRREVSDFLNDLLTEDKTAKKIYDEEFIESYPYLKNIAKALVFIKGYIEQLPQQELKSFGDYIYRNVYLIKNTTPKNTDLNKLFSTINSAGVQLEQTDIVKANLLNLIDEKVMFGKIWDACENMNNFFERNARNSFSASNWSSINMERLIYFDDAVFKYEHDNSDNNTGDDIFKIDNVELDNISEYSPPQRHYYDEEKRASEEIYCRSIINFGQLLLHTYRLHLKIEEKEDFKGTFHVNRLISIFKEMEERNDKEEIKRFFYLLWKVRYLFDKYIIKWVSDIDNKTESLELVNFNKNEKNNYSRTKYGRSASLMLQSVLYFTGDYLRQYWVSAYLDYLLYNHNDEVATNERHLKYLEKIDNIFSLNGSQTDKELSWLMMHQNTGFSNDFDYEKYLKSANGTGFKHYWFQKLEYILWKNWNFEKTDEYNNYRITSKNSVEHIYPQNPENTIQHPKIDDIYLHSLGNLVLLSVSQNSEYSNKSVSVKKSMFDEKKDTYDTLKSFYIFKIVEKEDWTPKQIERHRDEMIELFENHYQIDESKAKQSPINVENSSQKNDNSIENTNLHEENNVNDIENEIIPNKNQKYNVMVHIVNYEIKDYNHFKGYRKGLNNNNNEMVALTYGFYKRGVENCKEEGYVVVNEEHTFNPDHSGFYFGINLRIKCQDKNGEIVNQVLLADKIYKAFNQKFIIPKYINNYSDMGVDFFIVPNLSKDLDEKLRRKINADELGNNIHEKTGLNDNNLVKWLNDNLDYLETLYNQAIK